MTYGLGPINSQSAYLPVEFDLPDNLDEIRELITLRQRQIATTLNVKENGQYELSEMLSGQQWFKTTPPGSIPVGTAIKERYVYRKVIVPTGLPNATTLATAHNIPIDNKYIFTHIYGTATNPNVSFIPLPYINTTTPGDSVELNVDSKNVNIITTTANWTAYTVVYIVLEYIKNG